MPHCKVYGAIKFNVALTEEQLINMSYEITQIAINHKFGINLFGNVSPEIFNRLDLTEYYEKRCIPYEITDNPLSNECYTMFDGTILEFPCICETRNSRLSECEKLLDDILQLKNVSCITLCFLDVHGDLEVIYYDYDINPYELCETLEKVPNDINCLEFPAARFKITL